MIGRNDDPIKRFDLGIRAMKSIVEEIPNCQMNIVSLKVENFEKAESIFAYSCIVRSVIYSNCIFILYNSVNKRTATSKP